MNAIRFSLSKLPDRIKASDGAQVYSVFVTASKWNRLRLDKQFILVLGKNKSIIQNNYQTRFLQCCIIRVKKVECKNEIYQHENRQMIRGIDFAWVKRKISKWRRHINEMFHYIHLSSKYMYTSNTFFHLEDISLRDIDYPNRENYKNVLLPQHLKQQETVCHRDFNERERMPWGN